MIAMTATGKRLRQISGTNVAANQTHANHAMEMKVRVGGRVGVS
ncbi:hypothetical protein F4560_006627 [Saccharothrix ecbatanensis]|uniref:Uncharacterized protein n=1 Tax=Saccharothrix ecbatanensis TaxID=1105145 RepID=A0A7W9HRY6_9PSEU|nr:hypothetical protein [Saccharothrix ecbatanensis]